MIAKNISLAPVFRKLVSEGRSPFWNENIIGVSSSDLDDHYKFSELDSIGSRLWNLKELTQLDSGLFQFLINNKYIKRGKKQITINDKVYKDNTPEYRVAEASLRNKEDIAEWLVEKFYDWLPGFYVLNKGQGQAKN